jgi:DNA-binding NtrC family response regulator
VSGLESITRTHNSKARLANDELKGAPFRRAPKATPAPATLCNTALAQKIAALKLLVAEISRAAGIKSGDDEELDWSQGIDLRSELRRYEIKLIRQALYLTNGHQGRAAQMLGISASALSDKVLRYKLKTQV